MSKIKVYLRVRPPLPGEFDVPGCVNCTDLEPGSGNWIQFKKEGEPIRYFARVWGPESNQEEVFRCIGVSTVNDVFEGYYGCIFVYGQTGTGKTFTLGCLAPGLEGIQPQCIRFMFEKIAKEAHKYEVTVKQHYIQLYRDSVQDLLDITKDDLKIRMDDATGANIEKVTMEDINSYEDAIALIRKGDGNRVTANTKMNSASSRSHACLVTEVWRKEKSSGTTTFGRLYLIDLAGSERVSKSGVTDDAFKEAVAINKSLTTLGSCIAGLVNNEKVVSFRDSPLTRILQHSLTGHGRTSIVICIRPDSPNMQESLCTIKFGERAQKVESQMTPASYLENVNELLDKMAAVDRTNAEFSATATSYKRWAARIKASIVEKEALAKEKEVSVKEELDSARQAHEAAKKEMAEQWAKDQESINSKSKAELERLREANASVIKEIELKVADAEKEARERCKSTNKTVMADHAAIQKDHKKVLGELQDTRNENEVDYAAKAKLQMAEIHEKIRLQKKKLRGCKPSKFEVFPEPELRTKQGEFSELLDRLKQKKATLMENITGWDKKAMTKYLYPEPTLEKQKEFIDAITKEFTRVPTPEPEPEPEEPEEEASGSDSDPPSSEPPPSTEPSDSEPEEEEVDYPPALDNLQLNRTLESDLQLGEMLEMTCEYLDYGTIVYQLVHDPVAQKVNIHKRFAYLRPGRKTIAVCELINTKPGQNIDGRRDKVLMEINLADVMQVVLGQYSELFLYAVEGSPMVPQGTTMPKSSEKCSVNSLRVFFYRSLSAMDKNKKSIWDIVLNSDTDFEAWIVSFHRLTLKDPVFGGPLDIVSIAEASDLDKNERKLCIDTHIAPSVLLRTKKAMQDETGRLYYTLFDIRAVSNLDLLHAQKLFTFLIEIRYIERHSVYHCKWLDLQKIEMAEKKKKDDLRNLRKRILGMLRLYRKCSFEQATQFVRAATGSEAETLESLVKDHGPEPSEEMVKEIEDGMNEDSVDDVVQVIQEQIAEEADLAKQKAIAQKLQEAQEAAMAGRGMIRNRLLRFYSKYAPEKLKDCDKALQIFTGKEGEMFANLVAKYGPEPPSDFPIIGGTVAVPATQKPPGTYKERLDRFFMKYAPSRADSVDKLLAVNVGKEETLFSTLVSKFGPEPMPPFGPTKGSEKEAAPAPAPAAPVPVPAAAPAAESTPAPAPTAAAAAPVAEGTSQPVAAAPAAVPAAAPATHVDPSADQPAAKTHKQRLTAIFERVNPARVAEVDKLLAGYAGREEELFKTLAAKFGPEQ